MQWAEEIKPSLLLLARHGAHRIEGTQLGSQAENLVRLAPCNVLLAGNVGPRPEDIPSSEEDGGAGRPPGGRGRGAGARVAAPAPGVAGPARRGAARRPAHRAA